MSSTSQKQARLVAFYLPQFHPIPENNEWWGKGFTEWTNVAKAKPLFPGHWQPRLPADLGFYDLRVPETRMAQAELARQYGIEGFCYWHYWFAGRRVLDRPFNEVLRSGEPDFPFCLAWANQSWTGIWHGAADRMLIEQTYPGERDYVEHFYSLIGAFCDKRYLKIDGRPVFLIHSPRRIPDARRFTDLWRGLAIKEGLAGVYFIGIAPTSWNPHLHGFDAAAVDNPGVALNQLGHFSPGWLEGTSSRLTIKDMGLIFRRVAHRPAIYDYRAFMPYAVPPLCDSYDHYPCVVPDWDNTPRSGMRGVVLKDATPEFFTKQLRLAINQVNHKEIEKRIVFIKSWNEWAEGNYLEPDQRFGRSYLEAVQLALTSPKIGLSDG